VLNLIELEEEARKNNDTSRFENIFIKLTYIHTFILSA
jgi:hypothetical protein